MKINNFFFTLFMLLALSSCKPDTVDEVIIKAGAILDLSGDISEVGLASKAAIELSMKELNLVYASAGSPVKFTCEYADTRMDTSLAIEAVKKMYDGGIRLLVAGPTTSGETDLWKVKWYGCDANVQSVTLTADPTAARFAETVQFKGPVMGIGTASEVPMAAKKLLDDVSVITGFYPDYYCIHSYDAVQILGRA